MSDHSTRPGSDAAVKFGCICPVKDNACGAGYLGSGNYWISPTCPVQADSSKQADA